jgi:hypothetical protein
VNVTAKMNGLHPASYRMINERPAICGISFCVNTYAMNNNGIFPPFFCTVNMVAENEVPKY